MTHTNEDHSLNLIQALSQNIETSLTDDEELNSEWESMSMIIESFDGRFNSAHGYLYSSDGTITPVAAKPLEVLPFVEAYLHSMYKPDDRLPVAMLVQYSRGSGKYSITFEDTDENRWKVTPKNYKELREAVRPISND